VERCRERLFRVALARPEVRITLDVGTVGETAPAEATTARPPHSAMQVAPPPPRRVLDCAPGRSLRATFAAVYGAALGGALVPIQASSGADAHGARMTLHGAVTAPRSAAGTAPSPEAQHLFLHGRALRRSALHRFADTLFTAALDAMFGDAPSFSDAATAAAAAARPSRLPGRARAPARHVAFVLHLGVPPGFADVTSEPDKTVAAFRDDGAVRALLRDALLAAWANAGVTQGALRAAQRAADAAGAAQPVQPAQQQQREEEERWQPRAGAAPRSEAPSAGVGIGAFRAAASQAPPPLPLWVTGSKRRREAADDDDDDDAPCAAGCACARAAAPPLSLSAWPRRKATPALPPAPDDVASAFAAWRNPAWPSRGAATASAARAAISDAATLSLAPRSLDATSLAAPAPALIAQAGRTFLLALSREGVLLAVDPHAAHERIRLEELTASAHAAGGVPSAPAAGADEDLSALALTPREGAALRAHAARVAAWGFRVAEAEAPSGGVGVRVTAVPVVAGVALRGADLAEWLRALDACGGGGAPAPPAAARTLASRACRGAVMLGTALPRQQAQALLGALACTKQPMACAHGRPTAAPLTDVAALARRLAQTTHAEAHAAQRARPSVARAQALLRAALGNSV
jgi:DNA mismatch repair ATPase MutL